MRKESFKKEKYEGLIQASCSQFVRGLGEPRLQFVSITKVALNPDYSIAQVYWDTFDPTKKEEVTEALDEVKGQLRHYLSQKLNVRHTPDIELLYDSEFESAQEIEDILQAEKDEGRGFS